MIGPKRFMAERVSINDIAVEAGLHPSTVSLCLNDSPRVAEATKRRIREIARKLGYRPHPFLRTLMQHRREGRSPDNPPALAFATFFPTPDEWKVHPNPGLRKVFESARRQAKARGFRLVEFWGNLEKYPPEVLAETLRARGIQGMILAPLPHSIKTLDWPWEKFAVVIIGPSLSHLPLNRVRNNHFDSVVTAMEECHRRGYRRIGLALRKEVNLRTNYRWLAAYLLKQFEFSLPAPPKPFLRESLSERSFIQWIGRDRVDAVIVSEPDGPSKWLERAGHAIPRDIGLIRVACPTLGDHYSGVFENWEVQGVRAVNILINLLTTNATGFSQSPYVSLVNSAWNPGNTLRSHP